MELSKRLSAVARLVDRCGCVADIGTDHGYVPIFLVESGIADRVIAMDVNKGPLERARLHIAGAGLAGRIETRLCDGLKGLKPKEADTVIAAGMGGGLIIRILSEGKEAVDSLTSCVLQPQSEIAKVRRYLADHGLVIVKEDMVLEDGKYYPVMKAVHGEPEPYEEYEYIYGKKLLGMRHPILKEFLRREQSLKESIAVDLRMHADSGGAKERLEQVSREAEYVRQALGCFEQRMPGEDE